LRGSAHHSLHHGLVCSLPTCRRSSFATTSAFDQTLALPGPGPPGPGAPKFDPRHNESRTCLGLPVSIPASSPPLMSGGGVRHRQQTADELNGASPSLLATNLIDASGKPGGRGPAVTGAPSSTQAPPQVRPPSHVADVIRPGEIWSKFAVCGRHGLDSCWLMPIAAGITGDSPPVTGRMASPTLTWQARLGRSRCQFRKDGYGSSYWERAERPDLEVLESPEAAGTT
jgi:hypothetical protein